MFNFYLAYGKTDLNVLVFEHSYFNTNFLKKDKRQF